MESTSYFLNMVSKLLSLKGKESQIGDFLLHAWNPTRLDGLDMSFNWAWDELGVGL
jgi:hypothetical protein